MNKTYNDLLNDLNGELPECWRIDHWEVNHDSFGEGGLLMFHLIFTNESQIQTDYRGYHYTTNNDELFKIAVRLDGFNYDRAYYDIMETVNNKMTHLHGKTWRHKFVPRNFKGKPSKPARKIKNKVILLCTT